MKILLRCQAAGETLHALPALGGQGPVICCAPQPDAVATAQRLFPDRRIEVKTLYREPGLPDNRSLLGWMLRPRDGEEPHEDVRRRVIDTSVRLIQVAKADGEATLVAGPRLLRLMAFKLTSIGYRGGFLRGFKDGEERSYEYQV